MVWQWLCLEETHAGLSEGTVTGTHYGITLCIPLDGFLLSGGRGGSQLRVYMPVISVLKSGGEFEATP